MSEYIIKGGVNHLDTKIKSFLKENENVIKNSDFDKLYDNLIFSKDYRFDTSTLTEALKRIGINPFDYTKEIEPVDLKFYDDIQELNRFIAKDWYLGDYYGVRYSELQNLNVTDLDENIVMDWFRKREDKYKIIPIPSKFSYEDIRPHQDYWICLKDDFYKCRWYHKNFIWT